MSYMNKVKTIEGTKVPLNALHQTYATFSEALDAAVASGEPTVYIFDYETGTQVAELNAVSPGAADAKVETLTPVVENEPTVTVTWTQAQAHFAAVAILTALAVISNEPDAAVLLAGQLDDFAVKIGMVPGRWAADQIKSFTPFQIGRKG